MDVMQSLAAFKQNLHQPAHPAARGLPTATPEAAAGSTATSTSGNDATTITANDFLQLLVAEMRNQDPTADQDPNQYIDQLVQVNSLEQLISINQELGGTGGSTGAGTGGGTSGGEVTGGAAGAVGITGPAQPRHQQLGSAQGTRAAALATSLAPRPAQPAATAPGPAGASPTSEETVPSAWPGPEKAQGNAPGRPSVAARLLRSL